MSVDFCCVFLEITAKLLDVSLFVHGHICVAVHMLLVPVFMCLHMLACLFVPVFGLACAGVCEHIQVCA